MSDAYMNQIHDENIKIRVKEAADLKAKHSEERMRKNSCVVNSLEILQGAYVVPASIDYDLCTCGRKCDYVRAFINDWPGLTVAARCTLMTK